MLLQYHHIAEGLYIPSTVVKDLYLAPPDPVQAHAVHWISKTSTDMDTIATAARMVPEVEWPCNYNIAGVEDRLNSHSMACFDPTNHLLFIA